ncbi:hypothetical protein BCR39DRAFT_556498 [Naematelia encephala]|uniref:Uncharacterized protein n=1 Tax=Naematelia encephala TaxID=71784 RepID=A0A1Y2BK63_9TREE|nr:hypothetical protein BCR39DRAFT_556498 [Naematelia encephala]
MAGNSGSGPTSSHHPDPNTSSSERGSPASTSASASSQRESVPGTSSGWRRFRTVLSRPLRTVTTNLTAVLDRRRTHRPPGLPMDTTFLFDASTGSRLSRLGEETLETIQYLLVTRTASFDVRLPSMPNLHTLILDERLAKRSATGTRTGGTDEELPEDGIHEFARSVFDASSIKQLYFYSNKKPSRKPKTLDFCRQILKDASQSAVINKISFFQRTLRSLMFDEDGKPQQPLEIPTSVSQLEFQTERDDIGSVLYDLLYIPTGNALQGGCAPRIVTLFASSVFTRDERGDFAPPSFFEEITAADGTTITAIDGTIHGIPEGQWTLRLSEESMSVAQDGQDDACEMLITPRIEHPGSRTSLKMWRRQLSEQIQNMDRTFWDESDRVRSFLHSRTLESSTGGHVRPLADHATSLISGDSYRANASADSTEQIQEEPVEVGVRGDGDNALLANYVYLLDAQAPGVTGRLIFLGFPPPAS